MPEYAQVFCKICGAEISINKHQGYKKHADAKTCKLVDQAHLEKKDTCTYKYKCILNQERSKKPRPKAEKKEPIATHRYIENPRTIGFTPAAVVKEPVTKYLPQCLKYMPVVIDIKADIIKYVSRQDMDVICPVFKSTADEILPFPPKRGEFPDDYVTVNKR